MRDWDRIPPIGAPTVDRIPPVGDAVTSVSNSDGTITVSPTTGAVVVSANLFAPGRNLLVNGGFDVWQANTTFVPGNVTRAADGWWCRRTVAGSTVSRQAGTVNTYGMRVQRDNTNAATNNMVISSNLETIDVAWMAAALPTLRLTFWAKCGADFSAASSVMTARVVRGTGTDEQPLAAGSATNYTGNATLVTTSCTLTTTLQRFSFTVPTDASTNELAVQFLFVAVGTAGANDWFQVENAQLEIDMGVPSPFEYRSFGRTLADCLRYYQKSFPYGTVPATAFIGGRLNLSSMYAGAGGQQNLYFSLQARMRVAPTVTIYNPVNNNAQANNQPAGADCTNTVGSATETDGSLQFNGPVGGLVGDMILFHYTAADPNF